MNKSIGEIFSLNRSVVLIGMMGSGKTSIGKRLAARFGLPFVDVDRAIEEEQGLKVSGIFAQQGEAAFRALEHDAIMKFLQQGPLVLSPGGGAFANDVTRATINASGALTVWLKVERGILLRRVTRNSNRPLLINDPEGTLDRLLGERTPFYEQAGLTVTCDDGPIEHNAGKVASAILAVGYKVN